MVWIDLGNPYPLPEPSRYRSIVWPAGRRIALPDDRTQASKTLPLISVERRTRYEFGPVSKNRLGALFGLTSRIQSCGNERLGFPLTRRPAPSAGAIHPIHVIVNSSRNEGWHRYDPMEHALVELPSQVQPIIVRSAMDRVVQSGDATVLLFAAEPGKTFSKYANACSLVWRDAGVLLGYFAIAAEALNLNFSLLGVTGEPWVNQLVDEAGLVGVGVAFVGSTS